MASEFNNLKTIPIRKYLELIVNEREYGLFKVNKIWVDYFSKIEHGKLEELTKQWFSAIQKKYKDEVVEITDEGIQAIKELHELCNFSISQDKDVYHLWYL